LLLPEPPVMVLLHQIRGTQHAVCITGLSCSKGVMHDAGLTQELG